MNDLPYIVNPPKVGDLIFVPSYFPNKNSRNFRIIKGGIDEVIEVKKEEIDVYIKTTTGTFAWYSFLRNIQCGLMQMSDGSRAEMLNFNIFGEKVII